MTTAFYGTLPHSQKIIFLNDAAALKKPFFNKTDT
jgi:hypothetical protein